jgi:hypothetical protein
LFINFFNVSDKREQWKLAYIAKAKEMSFAKRKTYQLINLSTKHPTYQQPNSSSRPLLHVPLLKAASPGFTSSVLTV